MARLIDADALWDKIEKSSASIATRLTALTFVDKAPTVDAVPVVRCKDCKHRAVGWNNGEYQCVNPYYGMASGVELRDNDFCSYGERSTDG